LRAKLDELIATAPNKSAPHPDGRGLTLPRESRRRQFPAMNASTESVHGAERHELFDVLRGVAMLGIFAVNLWSFAMPTATYLNPTAYGSLQGLDGLAWLLVHVFFDSKFITLFSLLFGAGLVVMTARADAASRSPWARHLRRTGILLLAGLAHAYLLWWGDILYTYAICGLLVFMIRRWGPIKLFIIGVIVFCITPLLYLVTYAGWASQLQGDALAEQLVEWSPPPEVLAEEIASLQGSWTEQMEVRVPQAAMMQTFVLLFIFIWRVGGTMLMGMALYQWGILSGQASIPTYRRLVLICLPIGLILVAAGVWQNVAHDFWWAESMFLYSQFNYFGSLIMALGYIGVIGLVVKSGGWAALRDRLAAVGRMALTCYLGQTLIATTLFFGHGFGLFGDVSRVGQLGIFLVVSALQLALAPLWLKHYRQGPLEWLLRGAVYGKFAPLRLSAQASPGRS